MEAVAGVVVAGGASRRLGEDKRLLRLWGAAGPTLLEHTLDVLRPLCDEVVVVLNDPGAWRHLPARLVGDAHPGAGALGGIYAGLAATAAPTALVVAADMPLLSEALLRAMLARERDYDALVPRSSRPGAARNALGVEPLHAIYRRGCLPAMRAMLDGGERRVADLLARVRTAIVEPEELRRYDPSGHALLNINTPEDLAAARLLIARQRPAT